MMRSTTHLGSRIDKKDEAPEGLASTRRMTHLGSHVDKKDKSQGGWR